MLPVALACLALAGLTVTAAFTALRWTSRAHDRERQAWTAERQTLVEQVCHLAEKPWAPPPIRTAETLAEREPDPDRLLAKGW